MELPLAILFGLLIGAVVGTVGGGGAILALPVLVYVLGEGVSPATTAALIVVALGASAGAAAQARDGHVCWRVVAVFALPAVGGAYLGTLAGVEVSPRVLVLCFVPVMLAAAALTYVRGEPEIAEEGGGPAGCPEPDIAPAGATGFAVGAMTGFFGVGGGFLIVPALTVLLGLRIRRAIATSLAIITLTGLAALASHLAEGAEPDWPLTLVLSGAAAIGALLGTGLGRRLPARTLARAFAVMVAAVALLLLVDVLAFGGPPLG
ncbi:hypothetical protein BH20ACT15_BH20ACT15_10250 [soil metagenome]